MSVVLEPEAQLSAWIGNSIILMTGSMVFYGFTKVDDPVLQINPYVSAFIAIGLVLIDLSISLTALIPYNSRMNKVLEVTQESHVNYDCEKSIKTTYIVLISGFIFFQIMICFYIIWDTIKRINNKKR